MRRGERWLRRGCLVALLLIWGYLLAPASAQIRIQSGWTAVTALIFEATSTNGVRLDLEAGDLAVREGDDSDYATLVARTLRGAHEFTLVRVTTNYSVLATDAVIASGTYTGPFTVTLPSATSVQGKMLLISDQAGLAVGTSNRTITVSGLINAGSNSTITTAFGSMRLLAGVSAGSSAQWFTF